MSKDSNWATWKRDDIGTKGTTPRVQRSRELDLTYAILPMSSYMCHANYVTRTSRTNMSSWVTGWRWRVGRNVIEFNSVTRPNVAQHRVALHKYNTSTRPNYPNIPLTLRFQQERQEMARKLNEKTRGFGCTIASTESCVEALSNMVKKSQHATIALRTLPLQRDELVGRKNNLVLV